MKTKFLITALFTALLICFLAFSVSASCVDEHSYEYQVELGEEGFFGEITINGVCTATKCYSKMTEKIGPIFIYLGHSYNENSYAQGYIVNRESLAKYEKFSGDSLEFGAVTTTISVIGENNPLDKDGNPISEKVIVCDFTSTDYTFIDVSVKGIPDAFKNEEIVCSLYVKSRGSITYLDNAVEKTSCGARSYNEVESGVQKEEPPHKEQHTVIDGVSYRQLEMSFAKGAYWSSGTLSAGADWDLNKKFWASAVPLSKEDLPVGSVIILDCENYWQYRIDRDSTRGSYTKTPVLVIDEDWWGTTKTISFTLSMHTTENASSSPNTDVSAFTEADLKNALKIYVPVSEKEDKEIDYTKQNWNDDGALKVLLIGNSFSQDTCYLSYQAAKAMGIENVKIGNLYIGAGSISDHIYKHKHGATAELQTTTDGKWVKASATLETAVTSDNWDYIIIQQVSPLSGEASSFESANALVDIIEPLCPSARLAWNMTWAYQSTFNDSRFDRYDRDQGKMYQAIVSATQSKIVTNDRIEIIVPIGTVIQNVRTSYIGDTLTRDGYHLNEQLGRQISSLALVHALTGVSIDGVNTTNYDKITDEKALVVAIEAIKNAIKSPFEVTESQYKEETEVVPPVNPDINEGGDNTGGDNTGDGTGGDNTGNEGADTPSTEIVGYTQLTASEMELTRNQYYNSSNGNISTGTNVCYPGYYTVKKFTKETLPVGSKIFVAAGWQYRLIIKGEDGKYSNEYVKASNDTYVEITEEWWSGRSEICFTVSAKGHAYGKVPTTDLTAEEVGTSKFIIYIPIFSN